MSEMPEVTENYAAEENELITSESNEAVYRKPLKILKRRRAVIASIIALSIIAAAGLIFLGFKLFARSLSPMNETFYFTSDLLSDIPGKEYITYKTIDFTLCNFADELRTSKKNIDDFKVNVFSGTDDITAKCKISCDTFKLSAKERTSVGVSIKIPDDYYDMPVTVSVESFPISNTLSAVFTVRGDWGYEYEDAENEFAGKLIIWANTDVTLKLSWDPDRVTPDYSNLLIYEYDIDEILEDAGSSIIARQQTDPASAESEQENTVELKGSDNIETKDGVSSKIIKLSAGTSTEIVMFKSTPSDVYSKGDDLAKISVRKVSDKEVGSAGSADESETGSEDESK